MATKKTAAKATTKTSTGKGLQRWDEELARQAQMAAGIEENVGGGGSFISTQGGVLTFGGAEIPGNKMNVIIVDHILENHTYGSKFDPDNPSSPICFAFGRDEKEMVPHELSSEPQHDKCIGCPLNEFGSADTGKGKGCKNIRRLALITEDGLEDIENAPLSYLKIPVTSVKAWAGYVRQLATTLSRPPFGVVTEISLVRDAKTQFKVQFKLVESIESAEQIEALIARKKLVEQEIAFPYTPSLEDDEPKRGNKKQAVRAAPARKQVPAKKAPVKKGAPAVVKKTAGGGRKY